MNSFINNINILIKEDYKMTIEKKQYAFTVRGRITATDTEGVVEQPNLVTTVDEFNVNGTDVALADLIAMTDVETAVLAVIADKDSIPAGES